MSPEPGAVLTDAPALLFEPPFLVSRLQCSTRQVSGAVFLGIEAREVLADDLVGPVAFEALGP
jgi:hypothetical protein